jgi:nucleotide-binding universal stress UspA family protein
MILSLAEEESVSQIAMNAHGTDWLRNLVLGSTTFTVVRRTKKPVLIVRTGKIQDPMTADNRL